MTSIQELSVSAGSSIGFVKFDISRAAKIGDVGLPTISVAFVHVTTLSSDFELPGKRNEADRMGRGEWNCGRARAEGDDGARATERTLEFGRQATGGGYVEHS